VARVMFRDQVSVWYWFLDHRRSGGAAARPDVRDHAAGRDHGRSGGRWPAQMPVILPW